ncbi:MAG: lytic transglycosylase domain-containing protein [Betaproteobacteria bacterium]|nr:lytic transglycosylase domain-containing protein [Betaproteobacteria bacterium]
MVPILALAHTCAPQVAPSTVAAIVRVESKGDPLALHDNTTGVSTVAASIRDAERILSRWIRQRHSVDAGLMQINTLNFARYGVTAASVFDPCVNIRTGGKILEKAWRLALAEGYRGQAALNHAIQAYNSGSLFGAPAYAVRVWAAAGIDGVPGDLPPRWRFSVPWSPK